MNGFKNWSVIPARTWRIRQANEGDGWLKIRSEEHTSELQYIPLSRMPSSA